MDYYLLKGEEKMGPYFITEVRNREITLDTLIWRKGHSESLFFYRLVTSTNYRRFL